MEPCRPRITCAALLLAVFASACREESTADGSIFKPLDAQVEDARPIIADAAPPPQDAEIVPFLDGPPAPPSQDAEVVDDATVIADSGPAPDAAPDLRDPLCTAPQPERMPDALEWDGDCGERGSVRSIRNPTCRTYQEPPTEFPGIDVTLDAVVVIAVFGNDLVVMDAEGEAFNGIWVFNRGGTDVSMVRPGTLVRVEGEFIRFFELDEIVAPRNGIEVIGQGVAPTPLLVSDPASVADGGPLARALESRLVTIENVQVLSTAPDCPADFGNFIVSGNLWVTPEAEFDYAATRSDVLRRLTGVLSVSFDHRKILPRGDDDLDAVACLGVPDKCEEAECPVTEDAEESGALVITEIQNNPSGNDGNREFVELHNPGREALDVDGWRVQDCGGNAAMLTGRINPGETWVLARSLDERENGEVPADLEMGDLFLPNGFGSVLIFDTRGALVDQVRYAPDDPFPRRDAGKSLELRDLDDDNRLGESWREARDRYGEGGFGTPGSVP